MRDKELVRSEIIDFIESLRIYVNQDGGDLEFIDFDSQTGQVTIKILGACVGCEFIDITYNEGIEELLKENIPEVKSLKIQD